MRSKEQFADHDFFKKTVTVLLIACVLLMIVPTTVTWIYLAAISREITVATSGQSESIRALMAANVFCPLTADFGKMIKKPLLVTQRYST